MLACTVIDVGNSAEWHALRTATTSALSTHNAVQIQGRTKSLYSTMKKLLRLDDVARGGRGRDEVYDLLGLRVIVISYPGMPAEEAELAATQVQLSSLA